MAVLSAAVGSPAFSLHRLRFIYVEGERQSHERERFFAICGDPSVSRFLEGGTAREVLRRLNTVRELAEEFDHPLTVGAVIDRDFRTDNDAANLEDTENIHVMKCHEIENLFIHPEVIRQFLRRSRRQEDDTAVLELLQQAADPSAGLWVLRYALARAERLPQPPSEARRAAGSLAWATIEAEPPTAMQNILDGFGSLDEEVKTQLLAALESGILAYKTARSALGLWKQCLGKEALGRLASLLGLRGETLLEQQVLQMWESGEVSFSSEAEALRDYVAGLQVRR